MIKFLDLQAVNSAYAAEIESALARVARSGWYLRGEETRQFEEAYAQYIGTRYAVACGNGLDALRLILRAYMEMGKLHEGDEVIVPANTYIASILAITDNKLKPIFVEPNVETLQIDDTKLEEAITSRTRAIMLVHLYGRCAYTARIGELCSKHGLLLVEDNAQAHGCRFGGEGSLRGKRTGSLGHAAGHSFYPGKNLGALGDAGCVTTDDEELASVVRALGNYGSEEKYVCRYAGYNSRIDELQAAVLVVKLRHLDEDNRRRQHVARLYYDGIDNPIVRLPLSMPSESNVYHLFPIFSNERNELQQYLKEQGIETLVHYPIPPHKQQCYLEYACLSLPVTEQLHRTELSIPISPAITDEEVGAVVRAINKFKPRVK